MKMKSVKNYVLKKFAGAGIDEKCLSVVLDLSNDSEFLKRVLRNYSKRSREKFVDRLDMNRIEKYVYSVYFNHYERIKRNKEEGKPVVRLSSSSVRGYIKTYFKHYKFQKEIKKMIKKLKNKAYYDVFKNNK
ncbi:MAG: hypothetical protein M1502_03680 [Deltaproteobacteria bacterium]|jgi:hypothetical protein|nr:hypothetical protein [Deltaproteobacteria bacterium]